MKIQRIDDDGTFSATHRFMILLGPKARHDLTMVACLLHLTRQKTLWLCLVLRPYIKWMAEVIHA
jgi:hypothetical protein